PSCPARASARLRGRRCRRRPRARPRRVATGLSRSSGAPRPSASRLEVKQTPLQAGTPPTARPFPTGLARRDVLVQPEEVVGVVAPLERLEAVVLLGAVRLADPLLALIHQEVDVDT